MMQRVWILTVYFTKSLFFSLTGLILLILSLCLLYTSPSPRDRTKSRMPSFA